MGRSGLASSSAPAWCLCGGVALRVALFLSSTATRWLRDRVELSTAANSWRRVVEAVALETGGISPYESDVFHEPPVMLFIYKLLFRFLGPYVNVVFIVVDVLVAVVLEKSAKQFARYMLVRQEKASKRIDPESVSLALNPQDAMNVKNYVLAFYLLHPYTVASCVARSTCVFTNLSIAMTLLFTLQSRRPWAAFWLALSTYQCLYACVLLVPVSLFFISVEQKHNRPIVFDGDKRRRVVLSYLHTAGAFLAIFWGMLFLSRHLTGSWTFLHSTYGFHLTYPDMTPNVGIFWYFFIEIFDHFRVFYLWVFQTNAFFYVLPFAVMFRDDPVAMFHALLAMMAIFKPYPTLADAGLWTSMLPMWYFCYPFMRTTLPTVCVFLTTLVMGPILWHLWIYAGSANSNFYFAITLAYNVAQMFMITDLIYALNKRSYFLFNGFKVKDDDGRKHIVLLR